MAIKVNSFFQTISMKISLYLNLIFWDLDLFVKNVRKLLEAFTFNEKKTYLRVLVDAIESAAATVSKYKNHGFYFQLK